MLHSGSLASATVINNATIVGNGSLGSLTSGVNLTPGDNSATFCCNANGTGILNTGNLTLTGGNVYLDINGGAPGTGYDQFNVTGAVALGASATLNLRMSTNFVPTLGQVFVLIHNLAAQLLDAQEGAHRVTAHQQPLPHVVDQPLLQRRISDSEQQEAGYRLGLSIF